MSIDLVEGPNKKTIPLTPIVVAAELAIQQFYFLTIKRADKGPYQIHCLVKNIGDKSGTNTLSLYIQGEITDTKTFTTLPGQTYDYVYDSVGIIKYGASGTIWVIGDWGEETLHIPVVAGYYTTAQATLSCVARATNAIALRGSSRSLWDRYIFDCRTPPTGPAEHTHSVSGRTQDDWLTIYTLIPTLLPKHTYGCWESLGGRNAECTCTTR